VEDVIPVWEVVTCAAEKTVVNQDSTLDLQDVKISSFHHRHLLATTHALVLAL
jgi:hypothetical protein